MPHLKKSNQGQSIDGLPSRDVLAAPDLPAAVRTALDAWRETFGFAEAAEREHGAAYSAALRASTRLDRDEKRAEAAAASRAEDADRMRASRARSTAADVLIAALDEHSDEVRAVAARLALDAYAVEVDALLDAEQAATRRRHSSGSFILARSALIPAWEGRTLGSANRSPVEAAEVEANALALADLAGETRDLVEVAAIGAGGRLLTTMRRAIALVQSSGGTGSHGRRWRYADDETAEVRGA